MFAIRCQAGPFGVSVNAFYLKTQSINASTNTIATYLHTADASGNPNVVAARTSTMSVSATYGWKGTDFSTPLFIPANEIFYIAFSNAGMRHPICSTPGANQTHYYHSPTTTAWNGPFTSSPWTFLVRCKVKKKLSPFLYATGVPKINSSFKVNLNNALESATAILYTGNSKTQWNNFILPYDLVNFGAPGCFINSSWNSSTFTTTSASGTASLKISYPNSPALIGTKTFHQWRVLDANANSFGSATSNSGEGTIGS